MTDQLREALTHEGLTESSNRALKKRAKARRQELNELERQLHEPYRPVRLTKDGITIVRRRGVNR